MIKARKIQSSVPTFGIVSLSAPDAKFHPELLEVGIDALQKRGIRVVEGNMLHSDYFYLSGKPKLIADSLHEMFVSNEIDVIMCAGGGTVINKVLPYIDFQLISKNPKPLIGTSNITALLIAMMVNGIVSFHSSNVMWSYGLPERPTEFTHKNLMGVINGYVGDLPHASPWQVYRGGCVEGELIGGNLWTIETIIGSQFCPSEIFRKKILFFEEIGETFDKIDAMITHMDSLGIFQSISGVVIGKLEECTPPENVKMDLIDLLDLTFGQYDFPVIYDCDFGHVADNLCLPLGVKAVLKASKNGSTLKLLESGVC